MSDEYIDWWKAQFPCPCGHSQNSHFLAPKDGECRACAECHDDAHIRYGLTLIGEAHRSSVASNNETNNKTDAGEKL